MSVCLPDFVQYGVASQAWAAVLLLPDLVLQSSSGDPVVTPGEMGPGTLKG
jgi:hypothetical protein